MKQTDLGVLRAEALRLSRNQVKADLKAKGVRLSEFRQCDLNTMARQWFVLHREELIGKALGNLAWSRLCAELKHSAPKQNEPKSTSSAVQMSGSK